MGLVTTATRMWLTRSFQPFVFENTYDNQLNYENVNQLGLYVHIPFCETLCDFCPYCKVVYEKDKVKRYVEALLQEIELVGKQSKEKKQVTSVYFGGGSPALLAKEISQIMAQLKQYFVITEGVGLELHPNQVTVDTLTKLKQAGVTKISIGIQSFQDEFLHILGRKKNDFASMFEALKCVPFDTVSMDFIFALPGQTFELIQQDIDRAFENGANHIAIYPFIDFHFTNSKVQAMNKKEKRKLLDQITDYCEAKGYVRDSIWTFAKSQTKQYSSMTRHNFLGFGCSATTLLPDQFKVNTFSIVAYIKRIQKETLPTSLTVRFTKRQRMVYFLFWHAYTTKVSHLEFESFFDVSLSKMYGFEFWLMQMLGFLKRTEQGYEMTKKGAFYFHYYENFYTLSYIDKMWGIMRKEAFPEKIIL